MSTSSTNPPAVADETALVVRRTIHIDASVAATWAALTKPEHISRWFGRTVLVGDGAGAEGTMTFEGYGAVPLQVEAVDEPRTITYRWNNDDASGVLPARFDEATSTAFTFTLEPDGDGTSLTVVESGFERTSDPAGNLRAHVEGWTSELDKLVRLLGAGATAAS